MPETENTKSDPVANLPQAHWQGLNSPGQGKKQDKLDMSQVAKKDHSLRNLGLGILVIWLIAIGVGYMLINKIGPFAPKTPAQQAATDTRPLSVTMVAPTREITNPSTEITVIANKEISLEEHSRVSLQFVGDLGDQKYYLLIVQNLAVDITNITIKLHDGVGNTFEQALAITRKPFAFPIGFSEMRPWADSAFVLDGNDLKAQVDKQHRLLEDYAPADLLELNKDLGLYTLNSSQLRAEAGRALKLMLEDLAKETGKYVTIASGYRSYETQVQTYSNWVRELGQIGADKVSARPGHSEHQLGTTIDFVSDETGWQISNTFGDTIAGKWLAQNCQEYGFNLPYQQDQSEAGGYAEESWHFRYVGVE